MKQKPEIRDTWECVHCGWQELVIQICPVQYCPDCERQEWKIVKTQVVEEEWLR